MTLDLFSGCSPIVITTDREKVLNKEKGPRPRPRNVIFKDKKNEEIDLDNIIKI